MQRMCNIVLSTAFAVSFHSSISTQLCGLSKWLFTEWASAANGHRLFFQINLLTERKSEIERRLLTVSEERDILANQLDDAQDRILMLERSEVENQYTVSFRFIYVSDYGLTLS